MFGFLNSTILLAAAAALIPLLIHLFSRRRVKVVEFSSLKHLKEMQKRQLRRLKIRQWLLLILRMLIVLMAVLAFARPTAREGGLGSHAAVSAVLLVDNSPSMDRVVPDGNLLEIASQRAGQLLQTFAPSDRVVVLELDRSGEFEGRQWVSAPVAREQVSRMQRGGHRAKLRNGLQAAVRLLDEATDYNREVYYIGDRQTVSLPEETVAGLEQYPLYLVDLPLADHDNLGLVSVDFGGQLIHAGHDFNLVATIRNYGNEDSGERIASLFLDGKRVAQTDFVAPPGGETTVRFERSVASTGFHSGYIELSDDRLAADNRLFFSFSIPEQFNLLVVDADPVAPFVALALNPPGAGQQYWSVKSAAPDDLSGINFVDYQVVMLAGLPELPDEYVRRLDAFVRRGGALLLSYGAGTDIDNFNSVWSGLSGVTYREAAPVSFSRAGYYGLEQFDNEHPIFQPFGFDTEGVPDVKFFALPQLTITEGVRSLLNFSGGRPALVETSYGGGRVLTFCGPMSPAHSDLTSHGFFVPFVSRIMEYMAADLTSLDTRLYAGQSITRSMPSSQTGIYAVDLLTPDSAVVRLSPEDSDGRLVIRTPVLEQEGVYSVRRRGREIDRFALTLDPGESDLTPVDPDQLATAMGGGTYRLLQFDDPLAETLAGYRVGKELWQILLWIAVVLLAVEMLLGRKASEE